MYDHEKRLRAELYEIKAENSRLSTEKEETDTKMEMMTEELDRLR